MLKREFEKLAMRNNEPIGQLMYDSVESFYMSDNQYHQFHGGIDETKQDFVNRVFGGKINTPNSIALKLADEAIKENRYCLSGNKAAENRLAEMDSLIQYHYNTLLKYSMQPP